MSSNHQDFRPSRSYNKEIATDEDAPNVEQHTQTFMISQQSAQTNISSNSGHMSAAEESHSKSSSIYPQQEKPKLSIFSRFRNKLRKRKDKEKSVAGKLSGKFVSCRDDFQEHKMVNLRCHKYCKECFERRVTVALKTEAMWPFMCCSEIPYKDIVRSVNADLARKFQLKASEMKVPPGDRIYCIKPNCETWIPTNCINQRRKRASCSSCQTRVCTICRGAWHATIKCPQDKSLQATVNLAEKQGWKKCYDCNALVELTWGCSHMTCRSIQLQGRQQIAAIQPQQRLQQQAEEPRRAGNRLASLALRFEALGAQLRVLRSRDSIFR
ncbi:hypothetical protein SBOR_9588 [Sclerotinia borealis F-4128]|uniref:IBR domain-containing protein n=1 Tax=Sclerotinia borealis (strain F-4128) TaxID=1432307 RepID=W9BZM7_SCLBF|nr:hypothetical protein SBOR_9588 [Sclerotinia borealis F-4128]